MQNRERSRRHDHSHHQHPRHRSASHPTAGAARAAAAAGPLAGRNRSSGRRLVAALSGSRRRAPWPHRGPITRVALNLDAWDAAPRRVAVDGRHLRVGWFRHMDAHTIGLTRASQNRVVLLVIPPEATTTAAQTAMAMAADAGSSAGLADILAAAGIGGQDPAPQAAP
jgi:hypothetical protein